ncbi:ABC transporter ATP-binding protein [Paenibacillus sp. NPDC058071]|uniref:ABC transporter ATP-binding protein n=1 Tax=Paenibacillus sp. NPDC058071 TaxID=3346326 RepID=UPI0036DC9661
MTDLTVSYGGDPAIEGLTATIPSGSFVSLLGPSGCGKSTTLLAIAGLVDLSGGEIRFDDELVNAKKTEKRNVGMVFQQYSLYPHMTVYENIGFPLSARKGTKAEKAKQIKSVAEMLRIEHLLERKPRQLSGGQQQRAAIARALVKQPDVLLMDEPFSSIDSQLRFELRDELRRIQRESGITTLFVTHDQEEALSLSDSIMVMSGGRLLQYGKPNNLYDCPQCVETAMLLGHPPINLLMAEEAFVVGVRPEDWMMTTRDEALISGEVRSVQLSGRDLLVKINGPGESTINWVCAKDTDVIVGQTVQLGAIKEKRHPFDRKSGLRLESLPSWSGILAAFEGRR